MSKKILFPVIASLAILSGCANMSDTQRTTATGAGVGALGGAAIGALAGHNVDELEL